MTNLLIIAGFALFLFIPFFIARFLDLLTGKRKRRLRFKKQEGIQPDDSRAIQEAKNDIDHNIYKDFHNPGGPGG